MNEQRIAKNLILAEQLVLTERVVLSFDGHDKVDDVNIDLSHLPRKEKLEMLWDRQPRNHKGVIDGNRYVMMMDNKHGNILVQLDTLRNDELDRLLMLSVLGG
jgi:hypothetical protein